MKSCIIYANCQADGIAFYLKRAGFPYEIQSFKNYQLMLKEQSWEAFRQAASKADLFVYYPSAEKDHGEASSEFYINNVVPKHARKVSIPYAFNSGFFPLMEYGGKTHNAERVVASLRGRDLTAVLLEYDQGTCNFHLNERAADCIHEMRRREEADQMTVRLADWIAANANKRIFLNENHPSSVLFAEFARRVYSAVSGLNQPVIAHYGINEVNLPCTLPLSKYVIRAFGWNAHQDDQAHGYYRGLLEMAWREANL